MIMPRKQFDALERRRYERWERGQDPNVDTDEDHEDSDEERGPLREETIETLAYLVSISKGVATALYDNHKIVNLASL
jgi:hypothetical protein